MKSDDKAMTNIIIRPKTNPATGEVTFEFAPRATTFGTSEFIWDANTKSWIETNPDKKQK